MIDKTTKQFLLEHPQLKYVFFGGKGGVGKTVMAGAAAMWIASQGKSTLLASTNPVHSLSSLLDQDVFGAPTAVNGIDNLRAYEIDTKETIEKSKVELTEKLGMSSVYGMWVNKMVQSREDAKSLRELLSYSKRKEKDPLMEYLLSFRSRMERAKALLTSADKTAFFFITLPEALPIAVIKRFINWFHDFGIPVGGVVVNLVIDKQGVDQNAPAFVRNRIAMQDSYMEEIRKSFANVRAVIPLFEKEVRGLEMLKRTADALFA